MPSLLQDVYFDDDSAEVVISSLRLGDDQERYTVNCLSKVEINNLTNSS